MAMFFNSIDICNVASGIIYQMNNPGVYTGRSWRRGYLEQLATELGFSHQRTRMNNIKIASVPSTQHAFQALYPKDSFPAPPSVLQNSKNAKKRCKICKNNTGKSKTEKDRKTNRVCVSCELPVCAIHSIRSFQCSYCATADV